MTFTNSKNLTVLKSVLEAAGGTSRVFTDEHTQFSFKTTKRLINVYTTGKVTGQGPSDPEFDKSIEAHIVSTNAQIA